LDGVRATGRTWNIIALQYGKTQLNIKHPMSRNASEYKGLPEFTDCKSIIELGLGKPKELYLSLILWKAQKKKLNS